MDVTAPSTIAAVRPDRSGEERAAALAESRREATAQRISEAEASRAASAERFAEIREAIARVIGANTRLSVARSESSPNFVYRAIDAKTGEVVQEWPEERFISLVRGVTEDVRIDVDAGLMLDRVA